MSRWLAVFSAAITLFFGQYQVCYAQGPIITTIAGGSIGDGGLAISTSLASPTGACVDGAGNIYIADSEHNRIRKVAFGTGIISTVAGDGTQGYSGDGGLATNATLSHPGDVGVDGSGNIYIADTGNYRIRKVALDTGIISTVAGDGKEGYRGDGDQATSARLNNGMKIFVAGSGNIYISDSRNYRIRKVAFDTGIISTVAGNGTNGYAGDDSAATSASLNYPSGIFVDGPGNIYIADSNNHRIRKVAFDTGIITTVVGNGTGGYAGDGGPAKSASLYLPSGIYVDRLGDMYISDAANNRIRRVVAGTGIITTVAGGAFAVGTSGDGDGGPATNAILFSPAGVFMDGSGNIYFTDYASSRIRKVTTSTGIITTVAGGSPGDGGLATNANLNFPAGVCVDGSGDIYIADMNNSRVRKVAVGTGIITTVAGNGVQGNSPDGGAAINTKLDYPMGVAVDGSGNIYIADTSNNRIRKVAAGTGIISTVAGAGGGRDPFSGNGGPAIQARLKIPKGVFVDGVGNIYIADTYNNRVHKVAVDTGILTTVAGNGSEGDSGDGGPATSASVSEPEGIYVDRVGNIYIAAINSRRIRKVAVDTGIITTVAGGGPSGAGYGDGGPATNAILYGPGGVFVDDSGNIYIADTWHSRIRKVDASTGTISTIAGIGNGTQDFSGDGGPATSASLNLPRGIAVDGSGNIYIADTGNNRIRKIAAASGSPALTASPLDFGSVQVGQSKSLPLSITNTGTAPLNITAITPSGSDAGMFAVGSLTTLTVAPGETAPVTVTFTPISAGAKSASLSLTHNAPSGTSSVALTGTGTAPGIVLSPVSINAGEVPIGTSKTDSFTVSNTGTAPLVVTDIASSAADASQFGLNPKTFTLNPGETARTVRVIFRPTALGAKSATYSIVHNASGSPTPITLSMIGTAAVDPPRFSGPERVTLAATAINSTTLQTFAISNPGGSPLVITEITRSGAASRQFGIAPTSATIPAGGSQTFTVTFAPTSLGTKIASLAMAHNASGSPAQVRLQGSGVAGPAFTLSTSTLTLDNTEVGARSQQNFTLTNTGKANLSLRLRIGGPDSLQFSVSPSTATVKAGDSQSVVVAFSPTVSGLKNAVLAISTNTPGPSATIALSGTGTTPVPREPRIEVSPNTLTLAETGVGLSSQQTFNVRNAGGGVLTISEISVTGSARTQFEVTPAQAQIAEGQTVVFAVAFKPTSVGNKVAVLAMAHNGADSPTRISLQGKAVRGSVRLQLSPANLVMDQTVVGGQSQKTFTIGNTGGGTLSVTQITVGGSSGPLFSVEPGRASIPGGSSRTFTVTFTPTATGLKIATLTIVHNAQGSPATVRVRGQAIRGSGLMAAGGEGSAGPVQKPVQEGAQLAPILPATAVLAPNYPNPFNPETTIRYQLPLTAQVRLEIYDLLGQKVRTLVNWVQEAGSYQAVWDGRDESGRPLATGVYLYRLEAAGFRQSRRMALLR